MTKLNEAAVSALTVLSAHADGSAHQGTEKTYWFTYEPSYVSSVWDGFSPATLRSLVKKGLAEFHPKYAASYWTRITEDGKLALEQHRERTGFYA